MTQFELQELVSSAAQRKDSAMRNLRVRKDGFTLMELMIVVAILGILAAIAIPAFSRYVRLSKAAEARVVLKQIFNRAASYFAREAANEGLNGNHEVGCTVGSETNGVDNPNDTKQVGDYTREAWKSLGFEHGPSYYRYEIIDVGVIGKCRYPADTRPIYSFRAIGDLDDDGEDSLIELAVATDGNNDMFHAADMYTEKEAE